MCEIFYSLDNFKNNKRIQLFALQTIVRWPRGAKQITNMKTKKQVRKHNDNSENKITIQKTQQQI